MKRTGRPPLDPDDRSVRVCVTMPAKRYDALYREASGGRMSVPEVIRQKIYKGDTRRDRAVTSPTWIARIRS